MINEFNLPEGIDTLLEELAEMRKRNFQLEQECDELAAVLDCPVTRNKKGNATVIARRALASRDARVAAGQATRLASKMVSAGEQADEDGDTAAADVFEHAYSICKDEAASNRLEREGMIGDCLLRALTREFFDGEGSVSHMNVLVSEVFRQEHERLSFALDKEKWVSRYHEAKASILSEAMVEVKEIADREDAPKALKSIVDAAMDRISRVRNPFDEGVYPVTPIWETGVPSQDHRDGSHAVCRLITKTPCTIMWWLTVSGAHRQGLLDRASSDRRRG